MNKKKILAVIFDCDGVMFDSRQANINFYNSLLSKFGLPPMSEREIDFVHMHTAYESVNYIFHGTNYFEKAESFRLEMDYTPFIKDMIMEPGLKDLLNGLRDAMGLAIATNRSNTIDDVLKYNDLQNFFDIVISSLNVQNPKPDPESLHRIFDYFQIGPKETIYIGDSLVDSEMAMVADVPFIAYKNDKLEADFHIDCLGDIIDILKSRRLKDLI